jgi:hypothetical protein
MLLRLRDGGPDQDNRVAPLSVPGFAPPDASGQALAMTIIKRDS